MSTINLTFKERHAIIELNRPKAHAINMAMVEELREAFSKLAESETVQGVLLTGTGTIFSAGLDVVELYGYDETGMDRFWEEFGRLVKDLVAFPKPLVCAVNGHSPAGGCVLALACDYRIMANGKGRMGLNEIPVGIIIPDPIVNMVRHVMGNRKAEEMILHGYMMLPNEAAAFGVVHKLAPEDELRDAAEAKLEEWLNLPQVAWRAAKASMRKPLLDSMDLEFSQAYSATLREWWSVECRARVGTMIESLKKK